MVFEVRGLFDFGIKLFEPSVQVEGAYAAAGRWWHTPNCWAPTLSALRLTLWITSKTTASRPA